MATSMVRGVYQFATYDFIKASRENYDWKSNVL